MTVTARLRSTIKAARKRGAGWVRLVDVVRLLVSGEGRGQLWTRLIRGRDVHQTTPQTAEDRYPELFDLAAQLQPGARRILSFGCSTGEELAALRRRFPDAEIVGAEINGRSRRIAERRFRDDPETSVVDPSRIDGPFDLIFALAVLQREPVKVAEAEMADLSGHYPFARFDSAISDLANRLRSRGLLVVTSSHYRTEDSSAAGDLEAVAESPVADSLLFGADGRRLRGVAGRTMFRKR